MNYLRVEQKKKELSESQHNITAIENDRLVSLSNVGFNGNSKATSTKYIWLLLLLEHTIHILVYTAGIARTKKKKNKSSEEKIAAQARRSTLFMLIKIVRYEPNIIYYYRHQHYSYYYYLCANEQTSHQRIYTDVDSIGNIQYQRNTGNSNRKCARAW